MTARDEVLRRIGHALADRPLPQPVQRTYRAAGASDASAAELVTLLADRLVEYQAVVHHAEAATVAEVVAGCLACRGVRRLVVPPGFPAEWLAATDQQLERVTDVPTLSSHELDAVDGVVTTSTLAIAETGTIVLDGSAGQGRRALSLVPDYHLVVVRTDQVVSGVPDAIERLDPTRPATWISGPSATSDIELVRVEGVHGPRKLDVIVLQSSTTGIRCRR